VGVVNWSMLCLFVIITRCSSGEPMPMPPPLEMPPERKLLMDELIPLTGFITATGVTLDHTHQVRDKDGSWQRVRLGQRHMALKVIKRINKPTRCSEFEFRGMLDHRDTATLHDRVFTILPDEEFNGRQAWSNGRDVLSYVYGSPDNEGEQHGTWIVGDQGGVDSGFAYVKPKLPTLTPLDAHTTQGLTVSPLSKDPAVYHTSWFWLRGKDWIEASNVTLVCLDDGSSQGLQESSPWSSFYQVQFFESTATDALTTGSLQLSVVDGGRSGKLRYHSPTSGTEPTSGGSGAANAARIVELSDIRPLCALGQPVAISLPPSGRSNAVIAAAGSISPDPSTVIRSRTDTKSSAGDKETTRLVHLVSDEVSGLATFRLIFRDWQAQPLAGSGGVSDGDVDSGADSSVDYDPEVIVEYGPAGAMGGIRIEPVTEPMAAKLEQGDVESLWRADKGDYVWLWWYPASSSSSSFSSSGCPVIAEQAADELLLKVTYRHRSRRGDDNIGGDVEGMDDWAVLQRFDTDRSVQMKQTVLQRDTDLWLVRFDRDRDQESSSTTSGGKLTAHFTTTPGNVAGRGQKGFSATGYTGSSSLLCTADIHVVHASLLGSPQQTVAFLQHYLRYKDDQITHAASVSGRETLPLHERLSSCYFYHAAVSMPKAFIYAAEVLCVLLGAKPMAMIQYTSPTELQYKVSFFPVLQWSSLFPRFSKPLTHPFTPSHTPILLSFHPPWTSVSSHARTVTRCGDCHQPSKWSSRCDLCCDSLPLR